mgnify:CR=1 FL=1
MIDYKEKYKKYKTKYSALKAKMSEINKLSHLVKIPRKLKLADNNEINYADTIMVSSDFTIFSGIQLKKINNMKKGLYKIYIVKNYSLLAVHESYKHEITAEHLKDITFNFSGNSLARDDVKHIYGFVDYIPVCNLPGYELLGYDHNQINFTLSLINKGFLTFNMKSLVEKRLDINSDVAEELEKKYPENFGIAISIHLNQYENLSCYTFNDDLALLIES